MARISREGLLLLDTSGYPLPGKIVPCLLCADPFLMRNYIGVPDQVCPECMKTYADCAKVVCKHCKLVIGRVKPGVLDNAFTIQPRSVLHSDSCNVCKAGITVSTVTEIEDWMRKIRRHRPTIIVPGTYSVQGAPVEKERGLVDVRGKRLF